ncbi:polyamine oxidase [Selaginella moellendorffii]|nr:polyamine oxidase [Selaginella moellendorffii]|eukprot:XP_002981437.2 polyamine oxidase [Selaginella moellendorffii]
MATSLLILLVFNAWVASVASDGHTKTDSVVIVGAGISGIMAARTLSQNGINDFVILEATERIGGRMREEAFAGGIVEIGANWVEGVHGSKVNPIWTLANKYNLTSFYTDFSNQSSNIYTKIGYIDPSTITKETTMAEAEKEYVTNLAISKTKNGEQDISILTGQRLFGSVPQTPIEMCLEYQNYDFEFAEPPRVTSLENTHPNPTFRDFGDDEYFVADPRGYSHIVHQLAGDFLQTRNGKITDPRLLLNKVVRKIEYSKDGVKLLTEDGSTYFGKFAIVTASLGVLQSSLIKFQPVLPDWKVEALFQFDMAIYTKIFLRFPYTFWPIYPGAQFLIYCDERRGYYSTWQHLAKEFPGKNMIFVTVTDEESRRIEQLPDKEIKAEIMSVLRKMFGPNIPEIEEMLVPRWGSMKYFKGSYSNWPIGVSDSEFEAIQAPVETLYFAGEHTSQKYSGYVHGAYLTGIEAGKDLVACIKHKKCRKFSREKHKDLKNSTCKAEIAKEREATRQAWTKKMDAVLASHENGM